MKIVGSWIEAASTQALLAAITAAGFKVFFVGGCVRNAIIGVPVHDIDLATDAQPDVVSKIAADVGFRVVPTGIDHGTVTVIADGTPHEVTTLRRDVQTDGRHAVVAFSTDITEDATRRDFTMNALYALADGTVIDPLGGLPDLLARRVRFVGDPSARIAEDHLRVLRFFRFYAVYGDPEKGIDADGLAACAASLAGIDSLSRERVGAELRKLLAAPDPAPAMAAMEQSGVLRCVLPGATTHALAILVHYENKTPRSWLCRLAVLGGEQVRQELRLSRLESATLAVLRSGIGARAAADALGWKHGAAIASDILHARSAMFETPLPSHWQADVGRGATAKFPVSSADLMPKLQGKELGDTLKALQDRWLASGLSLTRDQLLG